MYGQGTFTGAPAFRPAYFTLRAIDHVRAHLGKIFAWPGLAREVVLSFLETLEHTFLDNGQLLGRSQGPESATQLPRQFNQVDVLDLMALLVRKGEARARGVLQMSCRLRVLPSGSSSVIQLWGSN